MVEQSTQEREIVPLNILDLDGGFNIEDFIRFYSTYSEIKDLDFNNPEALEKFLLYTRDLEDGPDIRLNNLTPDSPYNEFLQNRNVLMGVSQELIAKYSLDNFSTIEENILDSAPKNQKEELKQGLEKVLASSFVEATANLDLETDINENYKLAIERVKDFHDSTRKINEDPEDYLNNLLSNFPDWIKDILSRYMPNVLIGSSKKVKLARCVREINTAGTIDFYKDHASNFYNQDLYVQTEDLEFSQGMSEEEKQELLEKERISRRRKHSTGIKLLNQYASILYQEKNSQEQER